MYLVCENIISINHCYLVTTGRQSLDVLFHCTLKKQRILYCHALSRLDLLLEDVLERLGISSKLGDALAQLLDGHLLLVEVEAEERLVVDV